MPSPGEDVQSWSVTAANNGTADPLIVWSEGQARASVNNSGRSEMAAIAKWRNLLNGSIVTTGTPNAQQFLSGLTYTGTLPTAIPTGLVVRLKIGAGLTNTASTTLNMDGLGDVLIKTADGSNLLGGEFVANGYVDLLYNGTNWIFLYSQQFIDNQIHGGGGLIIGVQTFATAGTFTYTPSAGMECCIIECIGGGGGGGSAYGALGQTYQGGGGGGGGYSRKLATAADIGASLSGTVGAGGVGGPAGGNGLSGSATSLGSLCSANGGAGGTISWNAGAPVAGAGGTAGSGDITIPGTPGGSGFWGSTTALQWAVPGNGGAGPLGGGALSSIAGSGAAGTGYGAGGAGGSAHDGATSSAGGNGASGAVIITEFAGRGAPGRDGDQGPIGPVGPSGPGTGDVLRFGTPTVGQIARWTDASHIEGVATTTLGIFSNIVIQKFTASGTYTPTTGMKRCIVECIGGGGGGGGTSGAANWFGFGSGGGSGGYSRSLLTDVQIGVSKAVTIGAGGAGGSGASVGSAGGTTSLGTLCIANGGGGGVWGGIVGAGGAAGTGDITAAGSPGQAGFINTNYPANNIICWGGAGASGPLGGGANSVTAGASSQTNGNNGNNYGSGGGGAVTNNFATTATGGNGSAGLIIITEYI